MRVEITKNEKTQEYLVPESWRDITIEQLIKIAELNYDEMTDIEKLTKPVEIYYNFDKDLVKNLTLTEVTELTNLLEFVKTPIDENPDDNRDIIIDGNKYSILNPNTLPLGDVIQIEAIIKNEKNTIKQFPHLLTILLRREVDGQVESIDSPQTHLLPAINKLYITQVYNKLMGFTVGVKESPVSTLKIIK